MCARVCARAIGRTRIRADTCERLPVGVDRGWFGAQAFLGASMFNANIGAWDTARVTSLQEVCAAFSARAARHRRRDALGRSSVRRGPFCAAAPPMRARVCLCADVWARACAGAHVRTRIAARTIAGIHVCIYVYVFMCVYYAYLYRYMCTCVRDGYGRACGCTACDAHVRAIARADDAAVAK